MSLLSYCISRDDDGIVVGRGVGRKVLRWTSLAALQDRLGPEATEALIELLTDAREEWTAEMIERVGDRFERRLTDETTKARVEMVQGFAALRQDLADMRFELLKWTFGFWVGQLVALAGFLAVLARFLRPAG